MYKKINKLVCVILAIAMIFTIAGCGGTEDVWSEYIETVEIPQDDVVSVESESEDVISDVVVPGKPDKTTSSSNQSQTQTGDIKITQNGKSRYKIVVSLSNDGYDQGRLIQKVIKLTTGATVPLILDNEPATGPEIIVGDTDRVQSVETLKQLGNTQYSIKADKDRNIIICGKSEYVISLAAKKFLGDYFGYDENATEVGKEKVVPLTLDLKQNLLDSYKLVWQDEFEGNSLDSSIWCLKPYMSEQPHMKLLTDERAITVENGYLNIKNGRIDDENYFTGMPVSTADHFVFKYGLLEIRAKVPFGRPSHAAFWMQSSKIDALFPEIMSEIDIFETFGSDNALASALHKWYLLDGAHFSGGELNGKSPTYRFKDKETALDWHTYGLLWTPDTLSFMVDGEIYGYYPINDAADFGEYNDGMGPFHDYHHIILNNYLYTEGASSIFSDVNKNATTADKFPIEFNIDYIRLYQIPGQGGTITIE